MSDAHPAQDATALGDGTGAAPAHHDLTSTSLLLWPGETDETTVVRYAALPSARRPTVLVPVRPTRSTAAGLRALPRLSRLPRPARTALSTVVGRSGVLRWWPHQTRVQRPSGGPSLLQHLGDVVGMPVTASARFGPPRANRKPVLQLFDQRGRTVAFVKVGWNDLTAELVRQETDALRTVQERGLSRLATPCVAGAGSWRGLQYLLLDPLDLTSWGAEQDVGVAAMVDLAQAFERTPVRLSESTYWPRLLSSLELLEGDGAPRLRRSSSRLDEIADEVRIRPSAWHGDWTPWNMTVQGDRAVVWDWERFERDVPAGYDALHFAFHHAVRRQHVAPRQAIDQLTARAPQLLAPFQVSSADARPLVALYLLHLGHRHVRDGQDQAGAKKGPLVTWLFTQLDALVDSLVESSQGSRARSRDDRDPR